MWGAVFGALGFLLKLFGWSKGAPVQERLGQAEVTASNAENAVVELQAAARARADADAQRVRNDPHANDVHTDPAAPINQLPGEVFRD